MEMIKVKSSNVISIGWADNNLYIEYPSGTYIYENVMKEVYDRLIAAESKGKFLNESIKGKYNYRKAGK